MIWRIIAFEKKDIPAYIVNTYDLYSNNRNKEFNFYKI